MKLLSIFSIAACIFGAFVAATPIAVPAPVTNELVTRDDKDGAQIIDALIDLKANVVVCNSKWQNTCSSRQCSKSDIKKWCDEVAAIITVKAKVIVGLIPSGFVFLDATICINLIVDIILSINACLLVLLRACGILAVLFITVVLEVCISLRAAILLLIKVLAVCIPGLAIKVAALIKIDAVLIIKLLGW